MKPLSFLVSFLISAALAYAQEDSGPEIFVKPKRIYCSACRTSHEAPPNWLKMLSPEEPVKNTLIDLFPRSYEIAKNLIENGKLEEALFYLNKIDKSNDESNSSFQVRFFLGETYFYFGDKFRFEGKTELSTLMYEKAIENYHKAEIKANNLEGTAASLYMIKIDEAVGYISLELKKDEEAEKSFRKAVSRLESFEEIKKYSRIKKRLEALIKDIK